MSYQKSFLTAYAAAVRARNADAAAQAFEDQGHAEELLERARAYLR